MLVGAVACWIALIWVPVRELAAVAIAATLLPAAAVVLVRLRRARVGVTHSVFPVRAFAGTSLRISVRGETVGRARLPVLVEDRAPAALGGPLRIVMPGGEAGRPVSVEARRTARGRGRHLLGPLEALLLDPFGLAGIRVAAAPARSVVVYPSIEPLGRALPPRSSGHGGAGTVHGPLGGGDEFYEVREWQRGDDLRRIHWPSTARTGQLMLRHDETALLPRATVVLDTRGRGHRGDGPTGSLEYAIAAAASVVWHLSEEGFSLRLATPDVDPGQPRLGRDAAETILEALAVAAPTRRPLEPLVRRLQAGLQSGALIAILPPPGPDDAAALSRLPRVFGWCAAVIVDAPSFVAIPPQERAAADRRVADAHRALARSGWRVAVAGAKERFRGTWNELLAARGSRPSSSSRRS